MLIEAAEYVPAQAFPPRRAGAIMVSTKIVREIKNDIKKQSFSKGPFQGQRLYLFFYFGLCHCGNATCQTPSVEISCLF